MLNLSLASLLDQFYSLIWPLLRVTAFMVFSSLFSVRAINLRIRVVIALVLTVFVAMQIEIPRIAVRGALKHTGTLAVSTERGLRATTVKREGATEVNPRDLGIQQTGMLGFRLLRPDWALRLMNARTTLSGYVV